jgi:hypothetical protein
MNSSTDEIMEIPTAALNTSMPPQSVQDLEDLLRQGLMQPIGEGAASIVYKVRN